MPAQASECAVTLLETWRDKPRVFARDVFSQPLRPAQEEILDALADPTARRIGLLAPRGFGKTLLENVASLWWTATRGPDALVLVACPSERQVLTWFSELNRQFYASRLPALFPEWQPLVASLVTGRAGWGIRGQSSDSPALQEGAHADRFLLVIDEAKALPDDHFSALVGSCASSSEWRILAAGTGGSPAGWWYRAFNG